VNPPIHWFLGSKGLGIQQGTKCVGWFAQILEDLVPNNELHQYARLLSKSHISCIFLHPEGHISIPLIMGLPRRENQTYRLATQLCQLAGIRVHLATSKTPTPLQHILPLHLLGKEDVLNLGLSLLIGHLYIFEWYVVRCGSKNIDLKGHVFERDWTTCSKYDSHSRLNIQYILCVCVRLGCVCVWGGMTTY
jgi:hypothetical protein